MFSTRLSFFLSLLVLLCVHHNGSVPATVTATATATTERSDTSGNAAGAGSKRNDYYYSEEETKQYDELLRNLVDWFRGNDATLHDDLQVKSISGKPPSSSVSLSPFASLQASALIPAGTTLLDIPRNLIFNHHASENTVMVEGEDDDYLKPATVQRLTSSVNKDTGDPLVEYHVLPIDDKSSSSNDDHLLTTTLLELGPGGWDCDTVRRLYEELQNVKSSKSSSSASSSSTTFWEPYVNYLFETRRNHRRPPLVPFWSDRGRNVFAELVAGSNIPILVNESHQLALNVTQPTFPDPPLFNFAEKWSDWYDDDWVQRCDGGDLDIGLDNVELEFHAYQIVTQLAWHHDQLLPLVDLLQHSNHPNRINTKIVTNYHDQGGMAGVRIVASRDIEPGQVLCTSYDRFYQLGEDDDDDSDDEDFDDDSYTKHRWNDLFGTADLVRWFGIVEDLPQRWVFHQQRIAFELLPPRDDGNNDDPLIVRWITASGDDDGEDDDENDEHFATAAFGIPDQESLEWMKEHYARLNHLYTYLSGIDNFDTVKSGLPPLEWKVLTRFHQALVTALKHGIAAATESIADNEYGEEQTCTAAGSDQLFNGNTSIIDMPHYYQPLLAQPEIWSTHRPFTCPYGALFHTDDWLEAEESKSHYQKIKFEYNPVDDDVCMALDETVQICSSYRPHYHDMMVHYTARYLGEGRVKRMLFVGGGDSMILHEALKYPSLELVVGLELDQYVIRKSFKYFGTQPYFDDERVEWWIGDASKSLLMLPSDYFGSFDIVMVDLSETVMSWKVTDEMDVTQTLSLLLKPDGMILKNEYPYFKPMAELFEYTKHIFYYDVPFVCSQSMVLGRNNVDLLDHKQTDHKVEYLLNHLDKMDSNELLRDYQRNETSAKWWCKPEDQIVEKEPEVQVRSPGILMIVEAEEASFQYTEGEIIKDIVIETIEKKNLLVVSFAVCDKQNLPKVIVVMQEGYVVARFYPEHKYFAFDIHMWTQFDKQKGLKNSLIQAVGSKVEGPSSSSYRIVAGGMFGVSTWKTDQKQRGPKVTQVCGPTPSIVRDQAVQKEHIDLLLGENLRLIQSDNLIVGVVCGKVDEPCESIKLLENNRKVSKVYPLWSCPGVDGDKQTTEDLISCEKYMINSFKNIAKEGNQLNALILDFSAPRASGQVILKIFSYSLGTMLFFTNPEFMVSTFVFGEQDDWRKLFIHKFRIGVCKEEPTFTGEVVFNTTDSSVELVVTSAGDALFPDHLLAISKSIEIKALGIKASINSIRGGAFSWQEDFSPDSQFFHREDYNQTPVTQQWKSQKPLAAQSIFQLETDNPNVSKISLKQVVESIEKVIAKTTGTSPSRKAMETKEIRGDSVGGEGSIMFAIWFGGTVVVIWDGRNHVDVNIFTHEEKLSFGNSFVKEFKARTKVGLEILLQDDQPRGIGRVVNFRNDIKPLNLERL